MPMTVVGDATTTSRGPAVGTSCDPHTRSYFVRSGIYTGMGSDYGTRNSTGSFPYAGKRRAAFARALDREAFSSQKEASEDGADCFLGKRHQKQERRRKSEGGMEMKREWKVPETQRGSRVFC